MRANPRINSFESPNKQEQEQGRAGARPGSLAASPAGPGPLVFEMPQAHRARSSCFFLKCPRPAGPGSLLNPAKPGPGRARARARPEPGPGGEATQRSRRRAVRKSPWGASLLRFLRAHQRASGASSEERVTTPASATAAPSQRAAAECRCARSEQSSRACL